MSRWRRAGLWSRWALRDARHRGLQVLSIGLLLALGVGWFSALSSMSAWRTGSARASFAALGMHDLRVALVGGSYAQEGTLRRALAEIPDRRDVRAADERLVVPTQVDASTSTQSILVAGRLVGVTIGTTIDRLSVVTGRPLRRSDTGLPVAELERSFARHYGLSASGTVRITGGRVVRYAGQAQEPEYFVVTVPGADFGVEASFAVLFASLPTVQKLTGLDGRVNELVIRLRPGASVVGVQRQIALAMRHALPRTGFAITSAALEPAHRILYKDAEGDQRMMDVFALLLLGAATLAAFNLVTRTVEAQRREIGIGMALGVGTGTLARRPLLLGIQVALLGVILGVPVGIAAGSWLRSIIDSLFPLPVVETPFAWMTFAQGAALGIALPLLATAIPVWRAVRVRPVDAIRVGERAAGSSGLARLARHIRVPGGPLANLPLRNVLRSPRRTAMTMLGIASVVAILIALAGTLDSFNATVDAGRREALAGSPGRLTVDLVAPEPASGAGVRAVMGASSVGGAQQSLRVPVTLAHGSRHLNAELETIPAPARLWRPSMRQGSLSSGAPGIAIASRAVGDLGVHLGDLVAVQYPVPTAGGFQLVWTRLPVTAIHSSPFRFVVYANQQAAMRMHVAGLINRISVTPARGSNATVVKRQLLKVPTVSAVQSAAATVNAVDERMQVFNEVIVVTVATAMGMALLIGYNTSAINTDEREREQATMFAFGLPVARVFAVGVAEAGLIGCLGTAAGIVAGNALLRWIITIIMADTMPDVGAVIVVEPSTYVLALIAGVVVVALAPLATLHRLRGTDVPSALRSVE